MEMVVKVKILLPPECKGGAFFIEIPTGTVMNALKVNTVLQLNRKAATPLRPSEYVFSKKSKNPNDDLSIDESKTLLDNYPELADISLSDAKDAIKKALVVCLVKYNANSSMGSEVVKHDTWLTESGKNRLKKSGKNEQDLEQYIGEIPDLPEIEIDGGGISAPISGSEKGGSGVLQPREYAGV